MINDAVLNFYKDMFKEGNNALRLWRRFYGILNDGSKNPGPPSKEELFDLMCTVNSMKADTDNIEKYLRSYKDHFYPKAKEESM